MLEHGPFSTAGRPKVGRQPPPSQETCCSLSGPKLSVVWWKTAREWGVMGSQWSDQH